MTTMGDVYLALAGLFAAEGRPGGDQAAAALRAHADIAETPREPTDHPLTARIDAALSTAPIPEAAVIRALAPNLAWYFSGLSDNRIPPPVARHMATVELLSPKGYAKTDELRVGLFMQSANLHYPMRRHMAEETFILLGGAGRWFKDGHDPQDAKAGDVVHHPSNILHGSDTGDAPLIAAWRWTGQIAYDSYQLIEEE